MTRARWPEIVIVAGITALFIVGALAIFGEHIEAAMDSGETRLEQPRTPRIENRGL